MSKIYVAVSSLSKIHRPKKSCKWKKVLSLLLLVIYLQNLCYLLCTFVLYWSRSLSFQSTDTPARRSNNGSIILEVDTICWLIWAPHAKGKKKTGKGWGCCISGMTCDYQGESNLPPTAMKSSYGGLRPVISFFWTSVLSSLKWK